MSALFAGNQDFFGLDIGTSAIRLVQLSPAGSGPRSLLKYAYLPLEGNIASSDSVADRAKLGEVVSKLVNQAHVSTKNVAVGVPSAKVFTTVADVDRLGESELDKAIPLQADALIPTPLSESKMDWAVLGDSPNDKNKLEILLSSVPKKFVEDRLDMLEAIGLNVIAFEPDNLAMARAIAAPDSSAQLLLDVGASSTDLVIVSNESPHLTRSIPTGIEAIVRSAIQNLNIDDKQARQFVFKFGMSKEKLEGQVYEAIQGTVDLLTNEIEKSIKFYQTRYTTSKVNRIIVTSGAAVLPEFPLYVANKFGVNVEIANSWRNISYSKDRENELSQISNQFSVAAGLAQRKP